MWAAALVAGVVLLAFSGAVVRPGGAAAYRWKVHRLTRDALLEIGAAVDAYQRRDKTARRIAALVPEAALPRPEAGDRMDAEARAIATLDSWDRVTRVANRLAAENASDPTAGELRGLLAERKAQLAGALETQADISRRHVEKLRSVRPPDGYGDTHAEVLRLASEHADATAAYAAAWAAGERERIMRATRHLMDTQTGLIACAERVAAIADAT